MRMSEGPMLLSTVIPVYNAEAFLSRCLNSILTQQIDSLEIICVDDGSTDDSLSILREYERQYENIIVISQKNQHPGIARNAGMDIASGDYIHFMDADDYLYDGIYTNILDYLNNHREIDYLKLRATTFILGNNEEYKNDYYTLDYLPEDIWGKKVDLESDYENLALRSYRAPWGGIYKRELLSDIRMSNLPCIEDREFYVRVLSKAEYIVYFPLFAVHHQMDNPDSVMGRINRNFYAFPQSYNDIKVATINLNYSYRIGILRNEFAGVLNAFLCLNNDDMGTAIPVLRSFLENIDWEDIGKWCHPEMNHVNDLILHGAVKTGKIENIVNELRKFKTIYIYGAGYFGNIVSKALGDKVNIYAVITSETSAESTLNGYKIMPIAEISGENLIDDSAFFIATKSIFHLQIYKKLEELRIKNVYTLTDGEFDILDRYCRIAEL